MKQYTWSRPTRLTMLALLIALGIWFAYYARDLISALLLGALIAFILNPFLLRIEQRTRWPRSLTVPLVFLLFLIVFVGGIILLVPYLLRELNDLALELQNIQARLENTLADRTFSFLFLELRPRDVVEMLRGSTSDLLQPDRAFRFMQGASTNLAWITVILVSAFYLLRDWSRLRDWMIGLAPAAAQGDVWRLYEDVRAVWRGYLRGQLLLMLIIGALTAVGGAIAGLRGALALGIVAGALDVIPSVGPILAMGVGVGIAWFEGSSYLSVSPAVFALIIAGIFILIQAAENIWLRPIIMKYALQLHPGIVIIGVLSSLVLAGILITLIIVPLMGTSMILGRYLHARLLGLPPWPDTDEEEGSALTTA